MQATQRKVAEQTQAVNVSKPEKRTSADGSKPQELSLEVLRQVGGGNSSTQAPRNTW